MSKKEKILVIITSIVCVLALTGIAGFFIYQSTNKKEVNEKQPKTDIDLAKFAEYEKSFFGFVNPDKSPPLAEELDVHWQKPHPGPFVWGKIEKEKGQYDFTESDKLVRRAQEEGMITVAVFWPYAEWDQRSCHEKLPGSPRKDFSELGDYRQKPCDMEAYKNFVTAIVNRYDGDGPNDMEGLKYPIKYWEVMERPEVEGSQVLFSSKSRADEYIEILKATSKALKDSKDSSQVINGGIADLSEKGTLFWKKVLTESKDAIDIVGFNTTSRDATENTELLALKALMSEIGLNKAIWVTGVWFGKPEATASSISQEKWAEYLVKAYVGAIGNGASRFFYAGLNQSEEISKEAALLNCNTLTESNAQSAESLKCDRQKTLDAYKTMVKKIDHFDKVEKISEGQYRFFHGNRATYIMWNGTLPHELVEEIKITDVSGNEYIRNASDMTNFNSLLYIEDIKPEDTRR